MTLKIPLENAIEKCHWKMPLVNTVLSFKENRWALSCGLERPCHQCKNTFHFLGIHEEDIVSDTVPFAIEKSQ